MAPDFSLYLPQLPDSRLFQASGFQAGWRQKGSPGTRGCSSPLTGTRHSLGASLALLPQGL